jgi:hypothetical protein
MAETVDTTERLLTPSFDYDNNATNEGMISEIMAIDRYIHIFGVYVNLAYEWSDSTNKSIYVWRDPYQDEQGVLNIFSSLEREGEYTFSYSGIDYVYPGYHSMYSNSFTHVPYEKPAGADSDKFIITGCQFLSKLTFTKIEMKFFMRDQGNTWNYTIREGSNYVTTQYKNRTFTNCFDGYFTFVYSGSTYQQKCGWPRFLHGYGGEYKSVYYGTSTNYSKPTDRDDLFEDEYGDYWYKKIKWRYSDSNFTLDGGYKTAEAAVSVSVDPWETHGKELHSNYADYRILTLTMTFDEPIEAKTIWLSGLDLEIEAANTSQNVSGKWNGFLWWGISGYGELEEEAKWNDIETYEPKILIGQEEVAYEPNGEPYWVIRYDGDNFSPSKLVTFDDAGAVVSIADRTGTDAHLQWVLKFPNRGCKSYPEDMFMIDEVWTVDRGVYTLYINGQLFEIPRKWIFATKEQAIACFPDSTTMPYTNAKLCLRITCMALKHITRCRITDIGGASYSYWLDYWGQQHWDLFSPLIDPNVNRHKATNLNIRVWFGAIEKVEEIFIKDFKGAGFPLLTQYEIPPEGYNDLTVIFMSDEYLSYYQQQNPFWDYPPSLFSRQIMPNNHGSITGAPRAVPQDWKIMYSSINPCAPSVPYEGEGDETCV